jgi:fatty-acyl-CoA synthase
LKQEFRSRPEDELRKELNQHLLQKFTKWQLPDQILFVEEIPRTSVGKIAKRVIRDQHKNEYLQEPKVTS